jgi:hypothetical protein
MTDKVLLFDLEKETVKTTDQLLTHPKASRACVLIRETAYLAGGDTPDGPGGGIEVVPLPVTEFEEEEDDDDALSRGDLILTLGIIGAGVLILVVVGIYVHDFKKRDDADDDEETDGTGKKKKDEKKKKEK